jgi:hypothetical protein
VSILLVESLILSACDFYILDNISCHYTSISLSFCFSLLRTSIILVEVLPVPFSSCDRNASILLFHSTQSVVSLPYESLTSVKYLTYSFYPWGVFVQASNSVPLTAAIFFNSSKFSWILLVRTDLYWISLFIYIILSAALFFYSSVAFLSSKIACCCSFWYASSASLPLIIYSFFLVTASVSLLLYTAAFSD